MRKGKNEDGVNALKRDLLKIEKDGEGLLLGGFSVISVPKKPKGKDINFICDKNLICKGYKKK